MLVQTNSHHVCRPKHFDSVVIVDDHLIHSNRHMYHMDTVKTTVFEERTIVY